MVYIIKHKYSMKLNGSPLEILKPYIDDGGSWSFLTRFLAKIFHIIRLLKKIHPITFLDTVVTLL